MSTSDINAVFTNWMNEKSAHAARIIHTAIIGEVLMKRQAFYSPNKNFADVTYGVELQPATPLTAIRRSQKKRGWKFGPGGERIRTTPSPWPNYPRIDQGTMRDSITRKTEKTGHAVVFVSDPDTKKVEYQEDTPTRKNDGVRPIRSFFNVTREASSYIQTFVNGKWGDDLVKSLNGLSFDEITTTIKL
jgi:hypothetical protein